jgi:gentisate 1,2-dioxygenase
VEHYPGGTQPVTSSPAEHPFYFPRARLMRDLSTVVPVRGVNSLIVDSLASMKTMQICFHRFNESSSLGPKRNTASRIVCLMDGAGQARVGGERFDLRRGDVLAVPSWTSYDLEADAGALFAEVSDEPVLRALGFLREAPIDA